MNQQIIETLKIVITTFICSALIMPFMKRIAKHIGAMDIPRSDEGHRHIHTKATPKLGGIGIFLAFLIGYMLFGTESVQMNSILIGSFIIILTGIADDIKSLKLDIDKYEKMGCPRNADVNEYAKKHLASVIGVANGWSLPVTSAILTSQFQIVRTDCIGCGGSSHRGIDLGVPSGTNVYAAANGQVAYVVTSGSSLSCGGIKVYVYHNVNGRLYTTVYMHLSQALVRAGQNVTPNTVIAKSGGTESYDNCSTGAHLHFGVANGNTVSGFNSNAFNPRNLAFLSAAADGVSLSR